MSPKPAVVLIAGLFVITALAKKTAYPDCTLSTKCKVFGVDFHNGGNYFQNLNSTSPFTFVQQFTGCDNDFNYNILVDPNGIQYICSNTELEPDSTPELSTCPINKNQLYSGDWSVLVLSNNGNCAPIAYQRDFTLSVAPQQTSTYTPTVTFTNTSTPIAYSTETQTFSTTLVIPPAYTTTLPSATKTPTKTVTAKGATITQTIPQSTKTLTKYTFAVSAVTTTVTAKCHHPTVQATVDAVIAILPDLAPAASIATAVNSDLMGLLTSLTPLASSVLASSMLTSSTAGIQARRVENYLYSVWTAEEKTDFIDRRRRHLAARAVNRRDIDQPLVTVTDTNSADFVTSVTTSTAPTVTIVQTVQVTLTSTSSEPPVTVYSGKSKTIVTVTTTASTQTRSLFYKPTAVYLTSTKTLSPTVRVTKTPAAALSKCENQGGLLY